jgi:hypothetical protein
MAFYFVTYAQIEGNAVPVMVPTMSFTPEMWNDGLSIGVQSGPPIGAQKGPPWVCVDRLMLGAGFVLLPA